MDHEPRPFRERLNDMLATYGAAFLWVLVVSVALAVVAIANDASGELWRPLSVSYRWLSGFLPTLKTSSDLSLSTAIIFAPVFEEAAFRLLPLTVALRFDRGDGNLVRFVSIAVCGLLFGLLHGSFMSIFLQGAVGFLLAGLFIRNSRPTVLVGYLCCVAVHSAYNFSIFFGSLLRM